MTTANLEHRDPTALHARRQRAGFLLSHPAAVAAAACLGLAVLLAGCGPGQAEVPAASASEVEVAGAAPEIAGELDAVREATERFRDVEVAVADGYIRPNHGAHEAQP